MKVKRIASKRCRIGRTTNCAKCADVSRREKADSYTPYVCVLRRYVHLYNRVLYLQYRKRDGQRLQIEHIRQLPLQQTNDSINPLNYPNDGRSTEE